MKTAIAKNMTHAVVYVGAPYGDNEGGHIMSLHKSEAAAIAAAGDDYSYHGLAIVTLDATYDRGFPGRPAREYFDA